MRTPELVPQLLPQMVAGTCCRNEVAVATSHNHVYRAGNGVFGPNKINKAIPRKEMRVCGKYIFPKSLLFVGLLAKWSAAGLISRVADCDVCTIVY